VGRFTHGTQSVFFMVFWETETAPQVFPTVSQNTAEPRCITTTKIRFMTISVFRWNSCALSKCLNGHQGQSLKQNLHTVAHSNLDVWRELVDKSRALLSFLMWRHHSRYLQLQRRHDTTDLTFAATDTKSDHEVFFGTRKCGAGSSKTGSSPSAFSSVAGFPVSPPAACWSWAMVMPPSDSCLM